LLLADADAGLVVSGDQTYSLLLGSQNDFFSIDEADQTIQSNNKTTLVFVFALSFQFLGKSLPEMKYFPQDGEGEFHVN
jgi:hypothetical protein